MGQQQDFFKLNREFAPGRISHGDGGGIGRRKIARPFRRHCAIHVVLKSTKAVGSRSLLTSINRVEVAKIFSTQAKRFGVKIHAEQNVGNHIHAVLSSGTRESFHNFLRFVCGLIAKVVLRGNSGKFWTQAPFSRLINGRRDFTAMLNYIQKNFVEVTEGKAARGALEGVEKSARRVRRNELARFRRKK